MADSKENYQWDLGSERVIKDFYDAYSEFI